MGVETRTNWVLTCTDNIFIRCNSFTIDEDIHVPDKYYTYTYPISGVIHFNNHMHLRVKLTPVAGLLLDYLCQIMDSSTNEFHNDESTRIKFIEFMIKHCGTEYKQETVKKALTLLKDVGFIVKRSKAKRLIINPLYCFRGSMKQREALFKELLSEATNPKTANHDIIKKLKLFKKQM
jgi:hypothetical protein